MSQSGIISESTAIGGDIKTITGDAGGAVGADAAQNIDLIGTAAQGLTFTGTPASNQIQGTIADATFLTKGVASFVAADFTVTVGAVSIEDSFVNRITTDTGMLTPSGHSFSINGGEGMDVTHAATVITVTGEDASDTNKGIASFALADFDVLAGAVSLEDTVVKSVTTDSGAMTPVAHVFALLGGAGMDVTHAGNTITIAGETATVTNPGIVELATDAEAQLLADTARVLTPSNVGAVFAPQKNSGFQEWTGAGSYYTINTQDFVLDRPGIGWINNVQITWAGAQTEAALSKGSTHFIYIDSTGTIGSTTTRSTTLFQDNIVLFEVLVDNDTPANVMVVKENHSIMVNPQIMETSHDLGLHGFNVTELASGGVISLNGTLGVQVDGATEWLDSDLVTTVPDSAAAAITMNIMYTDAGGKWVQDAVQATIPTEYDNAGTPTALGGNQRAIYTVWVGKDDIESVAPQYFAVMGDVLYASLAGANTAAANDLFTVPTNELAALEMILMGYIIVNATTIDSVTSQKQTVGTGTVVSTGGSANLVSTDVTNFNGMLSASDTSVQVALETIDDFGIIGNFSQMLTANSFDGAYSVGVPGGWVSNLGITYSGNVLSVSGATAALSATNPGYIVMQDKSSPGLLKKYKIIADQGFIDDTGASEIIGNLFGLPPGVAYTQNVPFFIYAVTNDAEDAVAFMCSRIKHLVTSPVLAEIGAPDDAVADEQFSFFSFDNIDETLYDSNPCICIGSFRMTMSASDDWTVTALSTDKDGIGILNEGTRFLFPVAAFGAAAGTHLKDNGGTAPIFGNIIYNYTVNSDGTFEAFFNMNADGGGDGAGAVNTLLTIPFDCSQAGFYTGAIMIYDTASSSWRGHMAITSITGNEVTLASMLDGGNMKNDEFVNGARTISGMLRMQIRGS